ncbi:MAG: OmpA family protein [Gemmatimonadaceae bacterium]|nr:OmpA family protein [Gemmatimonadaceae bacterium]
MGRRSTGLVAAIGSGLLAAAAPLAAQAPPLTPLASRTTDAAIAQDLATLDRDGARVLAVQRTKPAASGYAVEKAQRWVALAREAYEGNARDPLAGDALTTGRALLDQLEAGTVPAPEAGTTLPPYATRVRDDLWRYADSVRALPAREMVAADLATLESSLIRAGLVAGGVLTCTREAPVAAAERAALAVARGLAAAPAAASPVVAAAPAPVVRVDTVFVERRVEVAAPKVLTGVPANVHFALNQDTLAEASKLVLDAAADSLAKYGAVQLTLFGNTDSRGSRAYNEALSRRRANRVRDYLVSRGIAAARIRIVAQGFDQLKTRESSVVDLARNRRVDLTYVADGKAIETREGLNDLQIEAVRTPGGTVRRRPRP